MWRGVRGGAAIISAIISGLRYLLNKYRERN